MKRIDLILVLIFACISTAIAQNDSVFENKKIGINFCANTSWSQIVSENMDVLHLKNQNNNLEVKIWHERTELTAEDFIKDLYKTECLNVNCEAFPAMVDMQPAFAILAECMEMRKAVRYLYLALERNGGLDIIQFRCPDECYPDHRKQIKELIKAVRLINKSESYLYYTERTVNS